MSDNKKIPIVCQISIGDEECFRVELVNDGTGSREVGHYNVLAYAGGVLIDPRPVRIENWPRGCGAPVLANRAMDMLLVSMEAKIEECGGDGGVDHIYGGPAPAFVHQRDALRQMKIVIPGEAPIDVAEELKNDR